MQSNFLFLKILLQFNALPFFTSPTNRSFKIGYFLLFLSTRYNIPPSGLIVLVSKLYSQSSFE